MKLENIAFLSAFLLLSACGGGSGESGTTGPVDATYRAECELECTEETKRSGEEVCAEAYDECVGACVAATSGLDTLCGKCVAAASSIDTDPGYGCAVYAGRVNGESCGDVCLQGDHSPRSSFKAECEVECSAETKRSGEEVCSEAYDECVSGCVAVTSDLDTLCGKCVAANSSIDTDPGYNCASYAGSVSGDSCGDLCLLGNHAPRSSFRDECEVECNEEVKRGGDEVCGEAYDECVGACDVATSGLDTLCGKCVAAATSIDTDPGYDCAVYAGNVTGDSCEDICVP